MYISLNYLGTVNFISQKQRGEIKGLRTFNQNGQGVRGSIPGLIIPKTKKMVFDASLLSSIIRYGSRVTGTIQGKK